nr:MAG TPA: Protein of unknown function (DUF2370) [Caudoviricetes sp.]
MITDLKSVDLIDLFIYYLFNFNLFLISYCIHILLMI